MAGIYDLSDPGARSHYAALRRASGRLTPFSSLLYADAAAGAYGLRGRIHLAEPDAGAVVFLRGTRPLRRTVIPPFTQFSALTMPECVAESDIHSRNSPLERILQSIEQESVWADLLCRIRDPRPATWRNWQVSPLYTYVLPTTQDRRHWSAGTRRIYRTQSTRFECYESTSRAPEAIALCQDSYARHGRSLPAHPSDLQQMVQQLGPMARTFVALEEDAPQAGIIVLHEGNKAHYWISGSKPGPAMTVLLGHLQTTLQASGIELFDLVGANTPSIAEFKRRFGPRLEIYFHLRRRPLAGLIN